MQPTQNPETPHSISNRYAVEELTAQFILSQDKPALDWKCDSIGKWHLAVEERLPCTRIRCEDEVIGWLLGYAIGPDDQLIVGELCLSPDRIEETIYSHGGRFLVILPLLQRVYLDPCGLLSAVYCEHTKLVASSPTLIPYDHLTEDRTELIQSMGLPSSNAMFPVGMTPRKAVERILPNHYLDLVSWQTVRHWPNRPLLPVNDVSAAAADIADTVKRQIEAIVAHCPATLRLTAGKDSRMLLACARQVANDLDCVTADFADHVSKIDCLTARKLARTAGVRHRILEWIEPDGHDLELWLFRTGFGTGEYRGWRASTTYRCQLDTERSDLVGSVGEIARGFFWRAGDTPTTDISAERLLQHCHCPQTPETLARVEDWKSSAIAEDSLQLLDLFYVEQRLGCWAGVWTYGEAANSRYQAFPLSHRRVVESMMRLPIEYRRIGKLPDDIIAREWPELLKYPFNTPTTFMLWVKHMMLLSGKRLRRATRDPGWALSRLFRR